MFIDIIYGKVQGLELFRRVYGKVIVRRRRSDASSSSCTWFCIRILGNGWHHEVGFRSLSGTRRRCRSLAFSPVPRSLRRSRPLKQSLSENPLLLVNLNYQFLKSEVSFTKVFSNSSSFLEKLAFFALLFMFLFWKISWKFGRNNRQCQSKEACKIVSKYCRF